MAKHDPLKTPDNRYLIVKGQLWRCSDPALPEDTYKSEVKRLMAARRQVHRAKKAGDDKLEKQARSEVDSAKRALGERGPVWWNDGAPDYTQRKVENTPYADWYRSLEN